MKMVSCIKVNTGSGQWFREWLAACTAPSHYLNSLAPGRSECDSKNVIFNLVLLIGIFRSFHDNTRRMPQDLTDDKSTLVQVMAWCRQATSHCLSQSWLSSLSPYGVARPQWGKWCRVDLVKSESKFKTLQSRKSLRCCLQHHGRFIQASMCLHSDPESWTIGKWCLRFRLFAYLATSH